MANLSMPSMANYAPNVDPEDAEVNLYANEAYDLSRPLSPTASMFGGEYMQNDDANASNLDISLAVEGLQPATPDVSGQGAGLSIVIAQMQEQLNALSRQLNAMQVSTQSTRIIAQQSQHAPSMGPEGNDGADGAGGRQQNSINLLPSTQACQAALIGSSAANQAPANAMQGNAQGALMPANAPRTLQNAQMQANQPHACSNGVRQAGYAGSAVGTVLRVPGVPNVPNVLSNAAHAQQRVQNANVQFTMASNAPHVPMMSSDAAINAAGTLHDAVHALQPQQSALQGMAVHGNYRAAAGQLHGPQTYLPSSPAAPAPPAAPPAALLSSPDVHAAHLAALKAARRPEAFDGRKRNLQATMWLNSLTTYLAGVPNDSKVQVASTYLTGRAMEWLTCCADTIYDYDAFCTAFKARFVDATLQEEALQKLAGLRQNGSVHAYAAIFDVTLKMAGIAQNDKITAMYFIQGLEPMLQQQVRMHCDLLGVTNNFEAAKNAALKIAGYKRLAYGNNAGHAAQQNDQMHAMQDDADDSTNAQQQLHATNDAIPGGRGRGRGFFRGRGGRAGGSRIPYEHTVCWQCNQTGHVARNCPTRQNSQSQNAQQAHTQTAQQSKEQQAAAAASNAAQNLN